MRNSFVLQNDPPEGGQEGGYDTPCQGGEK